MKKHEKAIIQSLEKNKIISIREFSNYMDTYGSSIIDFIFDYINERLDNYTGSLSIDNINIIFLYLERALLNIEYDKKIIDRKFHKLIEKVNRIEMERTKYFIDIEDSISKLEQIKTKLEELSKLTTEEINKYKLADFIIDNRYDINYLEQVFAKIPSLVNVKTKEGKTLYEKVIDRYIDSINTLKEEDILYYSNIISIIDSQKSFQLRDPELQKILKKIYNAIDKIHVEKNSLCNRNRKLELITALKETVLAKKGVDKDLEHIASKYNIEIFFPETLSAYYQDNLVIDNRKVIDDYIITIDKNAEVIDDGLSCKKLPNGNYLYGVHIADPLGYYDYNNPIIQEAINRTTNIYLPIKYKGKDSFESKSIPIFDYSFGANVASLKTNGKKYARSHFFEINPHEGIVDEYHIKSIINVSKNTTFDDVETILQKGSKDSLYNDTIQNLRDVTEILSNIYDSNKMCDNYNDEGLPSNEPNNYAHKIVQLAEILTGERVANIFAKNGYPCLYRVHHLYEEDKKAIERVISEIKETYVSNDIYAITNIISGLNPPGMYDLSGPHDGLKLNHYCRTHAPLRKGADIVMSYAQSVCLDQTPTDRELDLLLKELEEKKDMLNQREKKISLFRSEVNRTFKRRH